MRQALAIGKGRATLVVHQHKVQRLRPVGQGQRNYECLKELGLAGARGAGHQGVRAVLSDIEGKLAVRGGANHHITLPRLVPPAAHNLRGVVEIKAQQINVTNARRDQRVVALARDVAQGVKGPGHLGRVRQREPVQEHRGMLRGGGLHRRK